MGCPDIEANENYSGTKDNIIVKSPKDSKLGQPRIVKSPLTDVKLPKELKLVQDQEPLLVFTKLHSETIDNKKWIAVGDKNPQEFLESILDYCYQNNIQSIMVEGGTRTANQFYTAGLINEIWKIEKQIKLGEGILAPILTDLVFEKKFMVGQDNIWSKALIPKLS